MLAPSSPSSSGDDRSSSPRLTGPEFGVIAVAVGFIIFLMYQRMTVHMAAITAISTIGAMLFVVLLPRRISDVVKLLSEIKRNLSEVEHYLSKMPATAPPAPCPVCSPEPATQAWSSSNTPPPPSSSAPGTAAPGVGRT